MTIANTLRNSLTLRIALIAPFNVLTRGSALRWTQGLLHRFARG
jgi:hypothetical protein